MSFKLPQKKGLPVLDSPSRITGPKMFLTRRPLSVVGKPVLAEKHLPVQPSISLLSRKCYCSDSECLFRFRKKPAGKRKFRPDSETVGETPLPFESRSAWADEFPRQSLLQRSFFQCTDNETAAISSKAATFATPAGFGRRNPGMQVAACQQQICQFRASMAGADFRFISTEARCLAGIAKIPDEQINPVCGGFFAVLSAKKRSRKFTCAVPVLKTFADYLTATPIFFDGIDKRRSLPLDFSFSEAGTTAFSMQTHLNISFSQPVFAAALELSPEKRILEHERHENFVLESKIIFSPDFSRKPINLTHNQAFARACPENQRKFNTALNRIPSAIINDVSGRPASRIGRVAGPAFLVGRSKALLQKGRTLSADSGLFASPRRDPRFRLRLRLQRQPFPAASLPFSTILPKAALDLIRITNRRIPADFPRMRVITQFSRTFSVQSAFARVCAPADYRLKKANFMVRAAKHAHYTLARLRTIIVPGQSRKLTTMSLVFTAFAKTDSRLFTSPGKNYPELKFDKTGTKFTHRDTSLNLLGQNPVVTVISTGSMPRRIRPATPQPLPNLHIEQSPKRRKPLRQLRFKLHSINEGFVSSRLKPLKKIEKETSFFPTRTFAEKNLATSARNSFVAAKAVRQPRFKPRLRLRRFALQQVLPEQIKALLHLDMKICSESGSSKMPVRHFIVPDFGAMSLRRFHCRISLLPHPFGFPTFSFSEPRFYSLSSKPLFTQHKPQTGNLPDTGSFILKKDPLFLPPLSMKNPRRLLYNHLNPSLASKEFYLTGNLALKGALCPAARIADFLHTWLGVHCSCITPRSEEKFHRQLRLKQPLIKHLPEAGKKQSYLLKSCDTSVPHMTRINRLLLRARRFSAAVAKASIAADILPAVKFYRPGLSQPVLATPAGHEPQNRFSFFSCDVSQLQQKPVFNDDVAAGFKSEFHARFRSFRFPWRPETRMRQRVAEQPAQPDTGILATAIALPDELRSTAFIFTDTGTSVLSLTETFRLTQNTAGRHLYEIGQSLAVERRLALSESVGPVASMQNPEKRLQQFINPETFFIMREKSSSRMKKSLRSYSFRNTSKTLQLRPAGERYSEFGLKNRAVRRMSLEPLHWIIMMRSFLQPDEPAMHYCVNLPGPVRKHCDAMQVFNNLPGLTFAENLHEKPPVMKSWPRTSSWSMITSDAKFSVLAFQIPVNSETKPFAANYTDMPAIERESSVDRPPAQFFVPFSQPAPVWQPVHSFTDTPIKAESENRFIKTAMLKIETKPGHAQISIRHRPEVFKPAFIPEWIDQVWQRPGLRKT